MEILHLKSEYLFLKCSQWWLVHKFTYSLLGLSSTSWDFGEGYPFFFFFFENFAQSLRGKIPWNQIMFSGKLCLFYSGIFRWASHLLLRTIVYNYIIKVYEINFTVLFECSNMVFIYPLGVLANELTAISWGPQYVYIVLESWGTYAMYSSQTDDITC